MVHTLFTEFSTCFTELTSVLTSVLTSFDPQNGPPTCLIPLDLRTLNVPSFLIDPSSMRFPKDGTALSR